MANIERVDDLGLCVREGILQPKQYYLESLGRDFGFKFIDSEGKVFKRLKPSLLHTDNSDIKLHTFWNCSILGKQVEMEASIDFNHNIVEFYLPFRQKSFDNLLDCDTTKLILSDFIQKYKHIMDFAETRLHGDEIFSYNSEGVWKYQKNDRVAYGTSLAECRYKYTCMEVSG